MMSSGRKFRARRVKPSRGEKKVADSMANGATSTPAASASANSISLSPQHSSPAPSPRIHDPQGKMARKNGLGSFEVLDDELMLKVLKRLPIIDIIHLGATSRAFYQFATWEELWRKLCLERWNGDFEYRVSWRVTTFLPRGPVPDLFLHPRKPIPGFYSEKMYTKWWEATQTQWLMSLDPELPWQRVGGVPPSIPIDRISCKNITPEAFRAQYVATNRPVIITDVTPQWRSYAAYLIGEEAKKARRRQKPVATDLSDAQASANVPPNPFCIPTPMDGNSTSDSDSMSSDEDSDSDSDSDTSTTESDSSDDEAEENEGESDDDNSSPFEGDEEFIEEMLDNPYQWTPEKLAARYPDTLFKVNSYSMSGRRIRMTMADYVTYMKNNTDAHPLYIFDSGFGERAPDLLEDYFVPEYFWEDLFACLPEEGPTGVRPPYRWIVMGPTRSGTPFHVDPHGTSAWNALLYGYKRWVLYPPSAPGVVPPGVDPETEKAPHPLTWFTTTYPNLSPQQYPPVEFIQRPGDFIFVPSGWWHSILNLSDTIAVTQNFVNRENLDAVIQSFVASNNYKMLEFWKSRILPMRPELVKVFAERVAIFKGQAMEQKYAELKAKRKYERKQWRKREQALKREIANLKAQLGITNPQSATQPQASSTIKEDTKKTENDESSPATTTATAFNTTDSSVPVANDSTSLSQ